MKHRLVLTLLTAFFAVSMTSLSAVAEPTEEDIAALEQASTPEERKALEGKIREKIRVKRKEVLERKLELDSETSDKLEALLDAHEVERKAAQKRVRQATKAVAEGVRDDLSESELDALNSDLIEAVKGLDAVKYTLFDDTRDILTAKQRARLYLVLPRFHKKVKAAVQKAKKKKKNKKKARRDKDDWDQDDDDDDRAFQRGKKRKNRKKRRNRKKRDRWND